MMRFKLTTLLSFIIVGCSDGDPVPVILTIEELALAYEEVVGEDVILEGRLTKDSEGRYFLVPRPPNISLIHVADFQLRLRFTLDNVDEAQIDHCLDDATLVAGYVETSNRIRVEYVILKADALVQKVSSCYVHYQ